MKKLMTIAIMTLVPMVGFAKVSDFNAMISENINAQSQLHDSVKSNMDQVHTAVREKSNGTNLVVVEAGDTYNAPTKALTFHKEKSVKATPKAEFDRLANELNEADF